ncbi:MAG: hypothetical protein JXR63_01110, partial [Spirochaetales bacterium]|nr:hypothetical protein [Spirochaetales bacterium]
YTKYDLDTDYSVNNECFNEQFVLVNNDLVLGINSSISHDRNLLNIPVVSTLQLPSFPLELEKMFKSVEKFVPIIGSPVIGSGYSDSGRIAALDFIPAEKSFGGSDLAMVDIGALAFNGDLRVTPHNGDFELTTAAPSSWRYSVASVGANPGLVGVLNSQPGFFLSINNERPCNGQGSLKFKPNASLKSDRIYLYQTVYLEKNSNYNLSVGLVESDKLPCDLTVALFPVGGSSFVGNIPVSSQSIDGGILDSGDPVNIDFRVDEGGAVVIVVEIRLTPEAGGVLSNFINNLLSKKAILAIDDIVITQRD